MQGQAAHFVRFAKEKIPYAMGIFVSEVERLYGVLEKRLSEKKFIAGGRRRWRTVRYFLGKFLLC